MRFILSVCVLFIGNEVMACSCPPPPAPKKALEAAGAVFLGEAEKVVVEGDTRIVTFKVEIWWKGGEKGEVIIHTHKDGATCGYDFDKGKKYLVYAREEKDKRLHANLCSRTRTEKVAVVALRAFRDPKAKDVLELTRARWTAINFDNKQIVEECEAALRELASK